MNSTNTPSTGSIKKVFIASTGPDLVTYRAAVIDMINRFGQLSIAMEYFGAVDKTPLQASLAALSKADIFICIVAWRYGDPPLDQVYSITQLEYVEAKRLGMPCLVFLAAPNTEFSVDDVNGFPLKDRNLQQRPLLMNFRQELGRERVVDFFKSPDDLAKKVASSFHNLLATTELEQSLLLDIGSISQPEPKRMNAEVRFSLTNTTGKIVKVTSISLLINHTTPLREFYNTEPAAPIDELFLFARVNPSVSEYELLSAHHELRDRTEGFFLIVEALEGYQYAMSLRVTWNILGDVKRVAITEEFVLEYPITTPAGILQLLTDEVKEL